MFPRLAAGQPITTEEKKVIAGYRAVMMKRGPYSQEKGYKLFQEVRDKTIEEFRRHIQSFIGTPGSNDAILQKRLGELDAIERKYQSEIPAEVTAQIRSPWPTIEIVDLLQAMTWRILKTSGPSFFITCDNPVFFSESFGLKNSGAEVCFPVSSSAALHCSWKGNVVDMESLSASQSTVKEINRRLASTTSRFAFYHENALWISALLRNRSPRLGRILR